MIRAKAKFSSSNLKAHHQSSLNSTPTTPSPNRQHQNEEIHPFYQTQIEIYERNLLWIRRSSASAENLICHIDFDSFIMILQFAYCFSLLVEENLICKATNFYPLSAWCMRNGKCSNGNKFLIKKIYTNMKTKYYFKKWFWRCKRINFLLSLWKWHRLREFSEMMPEGDETEKNIIS